MTRLRRLRQRLTVVLPIMAAMLLISPPSAHATSYYNKWAWKKVNWVITHRSVYENNGSTNVSITITKTKQTVVKAEVTLSVNATGGMGNFMTKLGAEVGLSLMASGEHTKSTTITTSYTVPKYKRYVFYSGTRKASGRQERWGCSSSRCSVVGKRQGQSWTTRYDGNYQCGSKAGSGLAILAKREC
ncbi:hypothetical protein [Streptomyces sp. AM 2-1-1]|uniref:hypothetical protein n=1 Tax=Streptomyces sp. AM 2-1-1 TaxID=3028709 RepID=UPI0023B9A962|nr:hypothetical protein [Streptomyces sp. AM 2-1-1]WEH40022.1 hypothetical protein PZB77_11135 [Streptomyces sp. AM 2-1-1]